MKVLLHILILWFFTGGMVCAQPELKASYNLSSVWDADLRIWKNDRRTEYGYDSRGNTVLVADYVLSTNGWNLYNRTRFQFDNDGRQIFWSLEIWGDDPYELRESYEEIVEWNTNGQRSRLISRYKYKEYSSEYVYDYTYDELNRLIRFSSVFTSSGGEEESYYSEYTYNYAGQLILTESFYGNGQVEQYRGYWDQNGCNYATSRMSGTQSSNQLTKRDSTFMTYDSQCRLQFLEHYVGNPENKWELTTEFRYTQEFDEAGRLTLIRGEKRSPGEDWQIGEQTERSYDESGNVIYETILGFDFHVRIYRTYNASDQLIFQFVELKTEEGEFLPESIYEANYDNQGRIIFSENKRDWDTAASEYRYRSVYENEYGEFERPVRSRHIWEAPNSRSDTETLFDRRCDGQEVLRTITVLDSSIPGERGTKRRIEIFYLGLPPCATDLSEESDLIVYPNPATSTVNIFANGTDTIGKIRIIDATGRVVDEFNEQVFGNLYSLDVRGYRPGIYIVEVTAGDKVSAQRLVIR